MAKKKIWGFTCVGCKKRVVCECSNCERKEFVGQKKNDSFRGEEFWLECLNCKNKQVSFYHQCEDNRWTETITSAMTYVDRNRENFSLEIKKGWFG